MGMSKAEEEEQARLERARAAGLFRYMLIREAADPALSSRQRGAMVRAIAAREHAGPSGEPVRVTRWTLDVWIRAWRTGGFTALAPPARQVTPRTDAAALDLAAGLKRGKPARTAAQVARILRAACGWSPSVRTLQRHFERLELNTRPDGTGPATFGRFEAGRPNELWTGDALHGPKIAGRKAYLFAFLDDHCAPRGASLCPRFSRDGLGGPGRARAPPAARLLVLDADLPVMICLLSGSTPVEEASLKTRNYQVQPPTSPPVVTRQNLSPCAEAHIIRGRA